jgi:hypothetical protein
MDWPLFYAGPDPNLYLDPTFYFVVDPDSSLKLFRFLCQKGRIRSHTPDQDRQALDVVCWSGNQRYTEITHDPLLFSVAQGIF